MAGELIPKGLFYIWDISFEIQTQLKVKSEDANGEIHTCAMAINCFLLSWIGSSSAITG